MNRLIYMKANTKELESHNSSGALEKTFDLSSYRLFVMAGLWDLFFYVITVNIAVKVKSVSLAGARCTKVDRGKMRALWTDNKSTQLAERAREACEQSRSACDRAIMGSIKSCNVCSLCSTRITTIVTHPSNTGLEIVMKCSLRWRGGSKG